MIISHSFSHTALAIAFDRMNLVCWIKTSSEDHLLIFRLGLVFHTTLALHSSIADTKVKLPGDEESNKSGYHQEDETM